MISEKNIEIIANIIGVCSVALVLVIAFKTIDDETDSTLKTAKQFCENKEFFKQVQVFGDDEYFCNGKEIICNEKKCVEGIK